MITAEIVIGRRGHPTVKLIRDDGSEFLLHSLYDPEKEAATFASTEVKERTLVLLGAGLGYHIPYILNRNPHIDRVVIVEFFPALAEHAVRRILNPSIRVETITRLEADSNERQPLPADLTADAVHLITHPPSLTAAPHWYSSYHAEIATSGVHPFPSSAGQGRSVKQKLTVLVPYGAYYCENESLRGLAALGHRTVTVDYRSDQHRFVREFQQAVLEHRPDVVFSINHRGLGRDGLPGDILSRLGIPLAVWFVDSPEFILHGESVPPTDVSHMFLWDRSYLSALTARGYRAVYLPLAADLGVVTSARVGSQFRAQLSFVGNSLASGFLSRLGTKFPHTSETMALADRVLAYVLANRGRQLEALNTCTVDGLQLFQDDEPLFFRAYILHSATTLYRTSMLQHLVPLGLTLFGDPEGWQKIFGSTVVTRPDVNYFHETPAVYASSDINVNATSFQMPEAVNQRVFDVPLCGGFLLTDYQKDLLELFAEDEVVWYEGGEDLLEKAKFYRGRDGSRRAISEKAKARVLAEHTYQHRLHKMLKEVVGC